MVKEDFFGVTTVFMKENFSIIICTEKAKIFGLMEEYTKVTGKII